MATSQHLRLGVNIDHVATLRNARGGTHPDPVAAAQLAKQAGADGITAHLREDRRHIRDNDMQRLKAEVALPLNFEMAATAEMQAIALSIKPNAVCLVPEKREERTTEGGLNAAAQVGFLKDYIAPFNAAGIRVSLFLDPESQQLKAAQAIGAPVVELHTGHYAELSGDPQSAELKRLKEVARYGASLGIEMHAGHGLTFANVQPIAAIPELHELNIGHFLIGESVFMGLEAAIKRMRQLMDEARA
jgi:pyridoxine 5-phosphate synthase